MAFIRTIDEADAEGELARLYAAVSDPESGRLDHIMQAHSLHPDGLRAHWELYRAVMAGTASLRKLDRELIALSVSQLNACEY